MRILSPFRLLTLALACMALVITAARGEARDIRGSSGNNFSLTPTANPGAFILTHPGVAQVSAIGNCTFDGTEILVSPATPDRPLILKGTWRFTSADGTTTLDAEVEGTGESEVSSRPGSRASGGAVSPLLPECPLPASSRAVLC